jgi:3-oxoacyl-[acyl-carrier-protein] synthase-3
MAMENAGLSNKDIDMIIFATLSPDFAFPGSGVFLQQKLGMCDEGHFPAALDVRNQCSGFIYSLATASSMVKAGAMKNVLVVGAEVHSAALDLSTRGRSVSALFGDGAGAVIVQGTDSDQGVIASVLHSQGRFARELFGQAPMSTHLGRITPEILAEGKQFPFMNGQMVFKHATRRFCESIKEVLEKGGADIADVNLVIPHQANQRITDAVGSRMGLTHEQVFSNIAKYGNTTAASIPIALAEAEREGRLSRGDLLVTVAFGSGFTWGANLIRW